MTTKDSGISLVAAYERRIDQGLDPTQICRTCPKNAQKRIFKCEPDKPAQVKPIPIPGTEQPVSLVKKPKASIRPATAVAVDNHETFALANVESCGWQQLDKCKGCGRFREIRITVIAGRRGTKDRYRNITIGGYCSIGPGGIQVGTQTLYCQRVPRAIDVSDDTRQSCANCRWNTANYEVGMIEHATPIEYDLSPYEMELARQNPHPDLGVAGSISEARRAKGQVLFPIYKGAHRRTPAWVGLSRMYKMRIVPGGITYKSHRKPDGTTVERPFSYEVFLGQSGETATLYADCSDDAPPVRVSIGADGKVRYYQMPNAAFGIVTPIGTHAVVVEVHAPWYRLLMLPDRDRVQRIIPIKEDCPRCGGLGVIEDVSGGPSIWDTETKTLTSPRRKRLCPECDSGEFFQLRQPPRSAKDEAYRGKRSALPPALKRNRLITGKVHESCPSCDEKWGPCYYHLKGPKSLSEVQPYEWEIVEGGKGEWRPTTGTVMTTPEVVTPRYDPPARILRYDKTLGKVVDGNGDAPHPNLLLMRWGQIIKALRTQEDRDKVMAQVTLAMNQFNLSREKRVNYAWNKESPRDPWHGYCALNAYDKEHGGHPDGTPDYTTGDISSVYGAESRIDRGVLTRGLDYQILWNDQFGTPRSDQSTNPQRPYVTQTRSFFDDPYTIRDPKFCLPKYQARMEFERTTGPGMKLQEELLLNEGLEKAGRQDPTLTIGGDKVHVPYDPQEVGPDAVVEQLGIGLPIEASVTWDPDPDATVDDPDWTGEKHYWAAPKIEGPQRLPSKRLLNWLDQVVELEASEETKSPPLYITNRQRVLGYSTMHNQRIKDEDIISIASEGKIDPEEARMHMRAVDPAQERDEYLICSVCFSEFDSEEAGVFSSEEITDTDLMCPSGDGGLLIRRIRRPEWLEAPYQLDSDQVREFIDPTYRRTPDGTLAAPPDTASWNNRLRLEQMYCEHWTPKVPIARNQV